MARLTVYHIAARVHQVSNLGGALLVLDRLELYLRSGDVPGATCRRPFSHIFNLSTCKRLRNLLVFPLILNFDVGG